MRQRPLALLLSTALLAAIVVPAEARQARPAARGQAPAARQAPAGPTPATFAGLRFRNIGPASTGGRIGDIAIHPRAKSTWVVGVAYGGVWITRNAGTTWTPVFDGEG